MTDLSSLPAFVDAETFHVVVESPRGAVVKLKYDAQLRAMSISRPLSLGLSYPYDWGFIPSTRGSDGDPIDALVFWDVASFPGVVIPCRAVGVVRVEQNRTPHQRRERIRNDRIVAMPVDARRTRDLTLDQISQRVRDEIGHFVVAATALEGKDAIVVGWGDSREALQDIVAAAMTRA